MGYCLGGRLAFMMAEQSDADVNVSYYGVGLDALLGDIDKITNPLIVHIAEKDEYLEPDAQAKVIAAAKGNGKMTPTAIRTPTTPSPASAVPAGTAVQRIANGLSTEALAAAFG